MLTAIIVIIAVKKRRGNFVWRYFDGVLRCISQVGSEQTIVRGTERNSCRRTGGAPEAVPCSTNIRLYPIINLHMLQNS
jgi:hypothetical protein